MTPEEIRKLAVEYVAKVYGGYTDFIDEAENVISWLLRTHCIVSREKVREVYDNANHGDVYDRFENGYNLGVVEAIKSIFDPDAFNETDK